MPYIAEYFPPLVSGCPVTSAVIFAVCEFAHARMKMSEIAPSPTAAYPTGFVVSPAYARTGRWFHASARAESFVNSRRFIVASPPGHLALCLGTVVLGISHCARC